MIPMPRFAWWLSLALALTVALSFGLRVGYLTRCADNGWSDTPIEVQGRGAASHDPTRIAMPGASLPTIQDDLVANMEDRLWFGCVAPLSDKEELTAHVSPGYPWVYGWVSNWAASPSYLMRWGQCLLAGLTPIGCFFFSRRAFRSNFAGIIAGLLGALHPFWIANVAELSDGTAATFFLVAALALGARGSQKGGPFTALLFGASLGCLAMVRASLLPFAIIAVIWFLWECRRFPFGWLACFLTLFGFINVLLPWAFRNYQVTGQPVPIVNSMYLHLWMGNNPFANGSELDERTMRKAFPAERLKEVLAETDETRRYQMLAYDCLDELQDRPKATLVRRIQATLAFFLGERWLRQRELARISGSGDEVGEAPDWLTDQIELILHSALISLLILAFLGWRWSYVWRREMRIGTLALILLPLPFILSHGEAMSGPRLPFDGVLICFAAYGVVGWLPSIARRTKQGKSADASA